MFGKLTWSAIPFDQPIPLDCGRRGAGRDPGGAGLGRDRGPSALSLARMDHQRRPQADRRDVHAARRGDAAARLLRRHHDARPAGGRLPIAGLSAAGALQPDLLRARHHHDLLCRDAVRDRVDEPRGAAATRRARRGVSDAELGRLLADRDRRAARQPLARGRRVRAHRLAALSAAVGTDLFARRRRRLLSLVAGDLRGRHAGRRHQSRHHRPEAAHQGHDLSAHADILLDHAGLKSPDHRGVSDPDRDAWRC